MGLHYITSQSGIPRDCFGRRVGLAMTGEEDFSEQWHHETAIDQKRTRMPPWTRRGAPTVTMPSAVLPTS